MEIFLLLWKCLLHEAVQLESNIQQLRYYCDTQLQEKLEVLLLEIRSKSDADDPMTFKEINFNLQTSLMVGEM